MIDAEYFARAFDHAVWGGVVASAWSSGLLTSVWERPGDAEAVAERSGLDLRAVGPVLQALATHGLVAVDASGTYSAPFSGPAGSLLEPERIASIVVGLPDVLRGRTPQLTTDGSAGDRGRIYAPVVFLLSEMVDGAARALATELGPTHSVLDVGAGAGPWSLAMAEAYPGTRVTGLDLPEVVEVFAEHARARGVQAEILPGDYHHSPFPRAQRVVLANVLHLEDEAGARQLLAKAVEAVEPGGEVVVIEPSDDSNPHRARQRSLYAVQLMLRTTRGQAWSAEQILGWMAELGLDGRRLPLPSESEPLEALVASSDGFPDADRPR